VQRDNGSFKREDNFFFDPNVPAECQQKSTKAYGMKYDRGQPLCNLRLVAYIKMPYGMLVSLERNKNSVA